MCFRIVNRGGRAFLSATSVEASTTFASLYRKRTSCRLLFGKQRRDANNLCTKLQFWPNDLLRRRPSTNDHVGVVLWFFRFCIFRWRQRLLALTFFRGDRYIIQELHPLRVASRNWFFNQYSFGFSSRFFLSKYILLFPYLAWFWLMHYPKITVT